MTYTTDQPMPLEDYLAQGGVLSSPDNASARYRGEIMRLMASFVDSELAGSAGFADSINQGPGIKERIAASRITLEKLDHAERVLSIMGEFGANKQQYFNQHPWAERLPRDSDIGATRQGEDMRLNVFHYPLTGWTDAVVMNVLMGMATTVQLGEYTKVSYQPLAEAFRQILPRERRHAELGVEGLRALVEAGNAQFDIDSSMSYWRPRVAATFGSAGSTRFDSLQRFGLRHTPNEQLLDDWNKSITTLLADMGITDRWPLGTAL